MTTPEVPLSLVESARQNLESAKASLSTARGERNGVTHALAIIKAADHETPAAYAKALNAARDAVTTAEDAVRFWESKASLAEAALAPLEIEALRAEVQCGVTARALAVDALRTACEQLGPQLDRIREAVSLVRDSQAGLDRAVSDLHQRGAQYERPADDDLAQLVCKRLEAQLDTSSAALSAALAIVKHEESAPQREAERAEFKRRMEEDAKRRYEEDCRRGIHGEAEKARAAKEAAEAERKWRGNTAGAYRAAKGTSAWTEIQIERRAAGLEDLKP